MSVNYAYDNAAFTYLGRWQDSGSSMWSGWQGAQVRFKVSGTLNLDVNVDTKDTDTTDVTGINLNIDGANYTQVLVNTAPDIYTGTRTANFTLPDTGEHTIIMKVYSYPTYQFLTTGYCKFMSIDIDNGGAISAWDRNGGLRAGVVGDSWMGTANDWPFLLDQSKYWLYPISYGGAWAADLDGKIDYDYTGVTNTDDPTLDIIIVNSSVNDWIRGIALSSFNTSFASVVDKLRTQHPESLIVLLQAPRNTTDSRDYDKYGPEMESIAAARANVEYVNITSTQWDSLTWSDPAHLDYASRQAIAAYYESQIDPLVPYVNLSAGHIIY